MTNSLIVPLNSQFLEELLSLRTIEFFFCPVDPAASDSKRMGSQHKVAHYKASVIKICGGVFICKDDQHCRRAIKGIGIRSHNFRI